MYVYTLVYYMYLGKYLMHLIAVFNFSQLFVTHQSKLCVHVLNIEQNDLDEIAQNGKVWNKLTTLYVHKYIHMYINTHICTYIYTYT